MIPVHLYLDNFRGFSKANFPLVDVNFLVGENSTGKTSLLGAVDLFGSEKFWFEQDFSTSHGSFGHFKEIVSVNSPDQSSFRMGLVASIPGESGESILGAYLFTFKDRSGLPQLTNFTTRHGDLDVTIKLHGNTVYYKVTEARETSNVDTLSALLGGQWSEEHSNDLMGYKFLSRRGEHSTKKKLSIPIGYFIDEIYREHDKDNQGAKDISSNVVYRAAFSHGSVISLAPVRSKPRRTYDEVNREFSSEGDHTPYLLRDLLSSRTTGPLFKRSLVELGAESGLFESIQIKKLGKASTAPFELDVLLDGLPLSISNVGYGISQAIPIIAELLGTPQAACFAVQQPEVHLHPRAQAALGDFFFRIGSAGNKTLLIETHSDFMIDRFRQSYVEYPHRTARAQILFFERKSGTNTVTPIAIDSHGALPLEQPDSYRKFFIEEDLKTLGI